MDVRVLIFREKDFPSVDGVEIDPQELIEALPPVESVRTVGLDELKKQLKRDSVDLLVNPYGSAFPKAAWPEIYEFLAAGGNLLNLGGAPFSVPVRRDGSAWHQEIRQTAYHRELMINQVFPVETAGAKSYDTMPTEPLLSGLIDDFSCDRVFELEARFTSKSDLPGKIGSSGSREAILRPLLYGLDAQGRRVAAPIVAIDRVFGPFAGGRWVLANFTSASVPRKEIIQRPATFAALGPCEFQVRPSFACYYTDERASFAVHINRFEKAPQSLGLLLKIRKDNVTVTTRNVDLTGFRSPYYHVIPLEIPLSPGAYTVEAVLSTGDPALTEKFAPHCVTGFWCYDAVLVSKTQPLSAGKDFFMRDNNVSPLVGTTYMASDVHRKFLFEPNPAVWERDFEEMKSIGVNVVRTGIWTAFRHVMLNPGAPNEGVMRALTAFLLSAARHDITVIFTLFAFTPEAWEGVNPFLDPRSIQAQKEYVAAFAWRFSQFNNLMWDLINEPSFPGCGKYWTSRPNYDPFEERAWREWIEARHPSGDLEEAWRATPRTGAGLPDLHDFEDHQTYQNRTPIRALDYRLFVQDVFNRWARRMTAVIRQNGNPRQLITVGPDEFGAGECPNPQFHWKEVDFTCTHTWWRNDDLLWSGLVTKVPGKPSLVEETGIMPLVNPDKMHRRTEEDCRNLLERKFVMAFASGGAGVIEWVWNTNVYMASDCETGIGFHRADFTQKPELGIMPAMAAFVREARPYFADRRPEDVCMVIPHSNMFSVRDHATPATRACVRAMHYHCGVPMRAVGEYSLENLGKPRLIVVPSPRALGQGAWETLVKAMEEGAALLATGPIDWDEYWRPTDRLSKFDMQAETRPVTREEEAIIFGTEHRLSFGGEKVHRVDKAVIGGQSGFAKVEACGAGKLIYAPLPFELADNVEPTAALYQFALKQAVLEPPFSVEKIDPCVLIRPQFFEEAVLYSIVSETDADKEFELTDKLTGRTLSVKAPAQRAIMFLLSRPDGKVLAEYGGGVTRDT